MYGACCLRNETDFTLCATNDRGSPIRHAQGIVLNSGPWTRSQGQFRCMQLVHDLEPQSRVHLPLRSYMFCGSAYMTGTQALRCPQRACCLHSQAPQRTRVAATRPKVANRTRTHVLRAAITQAAVIEKEEGDREGGTGMYVSTTRLWRCMACISLPCTTALPACSCVRYLWTLQGSVCCCCQCCDTSLHIQAVF